MGHHAGDELHVHQTLALRGDVDERRRHADRDDQHVAAGMGGGVGGGEAWSETVERCTALRWLVQCSPNIYAGGKCNFFLKLCGIMHYLNGIMRCRKNVM